MKTYIFRTFVSGLLLVSSVACTHDVTSASQPASTVVDKESSLANDAPAIPDSADIDAEARRLMEAHNLPGLALAVVDKGEVVFMETYGARILDPLLPLEADTVMYGASLTKFVFANFLMQQVEQRKLDLDVPLATYFPKPLPDYEEWADLADQPQWQDLTLQHVLMHTTGWANYRFFPPETNYAYTPGAKLRFFYEPGERYGYSGEAFILAQRVLEEYLGMDVAKEMDNALFEPLGMSRTSMIWQEAFADNFARGYDVDGNNLGHNLQDNARAAGSMDTTLQDYTAFVTAFLAGDVVSPETRDAMLEPLLAITSDTKFPTLDRGSDPERNRAVNLSVGLGFVVWDGPHGHGFMKAGHNEKTDNMMLCLSETGQCVVALMNTAKGDLVYPDLVEFILGGTGFPWDWEYASLNKAG